MRRIDVHTSERGAALWWVWPARRGILADGYGLRVVEAAEAARWLRAHGYWSQAELVGAAG
jgi:hypothetical protein